MANVGLTNLARPTIRFLVVALRGEADGCTVRVAASVREALETRAGVDIDYTHPSARYANDTA